MSEIQSNEIDGYEEQEGGDDNGYEEQEYDENGLDESDLKNLEEIENFTGQINADDYEELTEEERQMHELELEMDKAALEAENNAKNSESTGGGGAFLPAGAVPSKNGVLSPHAAEFWFPESRNCPCCVGFKHGCTCRSVTVDTCTHPECENLEYKEQVATTLASRSNSDSSTLPSRSNSYSATLRTSNAGYVIESPGESPRGGGGEICKFFQQGSCMRGNSCRFLHVPGSGSASPSGYGVPSPGSMSPSSQECVYFKRGQCQYGDSCRFVHVQSFAYPPQP